MLCAKWFSSLGLAACPNVCNLSNTNLLWEPSLRLGGHNNPNPRDATARIRSLGH